MIVMFLDRQLNESYFSTFGVSQSGLAFDFIAIAKFGMQLSFRGVLDRNSVCREKK